MPAFAHNVFDRTVGNHRDAPALHGIQPSLMILARMQRAVFGKDDAPEILVGVDFGPKITALDDFERLAQRPPGGDGQEGGNDGDTTGR